jgi:hypothetical protein
VHVNADWNMTVGVNSETDSIIKFDLFGSRVPALFTVAAMESTRGS